MDFLGSKVVFLLIRKLAVPRDYRSVDGKSVTVHGETQILPFLFTEAGKYRLRNIRLNVLKCSDTFVAPGCGCADEIILGSPIMLKSGLDVKDFIASNFQRLESIDYSSNTAIDYYSKLGKLGRILASGNPGVTDLYDPL